MNIGVKSCKFTTLDQKDLVNYNIGLVITKDKKMIHANELTKYTELDRYEISNILARSGYTGCSFNSVKFLGITNGGDFCYSVKYFDDDGTGEQIGKVYVNKSATGDMVAEF